MTDPETTAAARIALAGREAEYRQAMAECERLREARDRAIVLAVELGVPNAEIADVLGVTAGRVSQLYRAAQDKSTRRNQ